MFSLNKILFKIIDNLINQRTNEEQLQQDLEEILHNDKCLTKKQYNQLYNIIHNGAYYLLYSTNKCYKEAIKYNKVIKNNKNISTVELYEKFKESCLSII